MARVRLLTEDQVRRIRRTKPDKHGMGISNRRMAAEMGVCSAVIRDIRAWQTYKDVL